MSAQGNANIWQPQVVGQSGTDRPTADKAEKILDKFGIEYETYVASAHRTPDRVVKIVKDSNADVFIALAGLSAALPGVVAAHTLKPVIEYLVYSKVFSIVSIICIVLIYQYLFIYFSKEYICTVSSFCLKPYIKG